MKGAISGGVLTWDKHLAKNQPGSIKQTKLTNSAPGYLGLSVMQIQVATMSLALVFLAIFGGTLVLLLTGKPVVAGPSREVEQIKKKYGGRIAEAALQTATEVEKVIRLSSIDKLVTVADELGKPIIHQVIDADEVVTHAYFVFDGRTRYQYMVDAVEVVTQKM